MTLIKVACAALSLLCTVKADGILQARNPYYGGYALPGTSADGAVNGCPADTLTCSNQVFTFCCPNYTFCGPYGEGPYCCPTSDDCGSVVGAGQTCADPSWTLYIDAFPWCCTPDDVGLALGDGECQPRSLTYSSSEYASTLVQANSASPPSSWIGGVPSGLSTNGATATAAATTTSTTSKATAGATGAQTTTSSAATTSSSTAAATTTAKSSSGTTVGYSTVIGALVFVGTFLAAIML